MIHAIEKQDLKELVGRKNLCVVDFFATWCGPCKMLAPVLEELAEQLEGKVQFYKVDIDGNQNLAMQYQIEAVPTVLLIKEGKVVDKFVGYHSKQDISQMLTKWM